MHTHLGACSPSPVIRVPFTLVVEGGDIYATFTKRNICSALRQIKGGQRNVPASVNSQLPSTQNSLYAKWYILGWHFLDPSINIGYNI